MMHMVRTTVTLDADTEQIVRRLMREQGISFKEAINNAIRHSIAADVTWEDFHTDTASMGEPTINLDRALQIAGDLEDEELIRQMRSGL